jgi:hypothetical protein
MGWFICKYDLIFRENVVRTNVGVEPKSARRSIEASVFYWILIHFPASAFSDFPVFLSILGQMRMGAKLSTLSLTPLCEHLSQRYEINGLDKVWVYLQTNSWTDRRTDGRTSQWIDELINGLIKSGYVYKPSGGRTEGRMECQMNRRADNGLAKVWVCSQTVGWTDGWTDGMADE